MLFISPPFGTYISLPKCKSIKGSYTLEERKGLISQIFKTLYYDNSLNGWVNKIGLRNKGIDHGLKYYNHKSDILSIAILKESDIDTFIKKIPNDTNLEINVSCPNLNKELVNNNLQKFINKDRKWCILKCGPLTNEQQLDNYYKIGFRQFHFSNTLPVRNGGLSGQSLIPYTQSLSKYMKTKYENTTIICGGGIQSINEINNYKYGDHHSISTILFNPFKFSKLYLDYLYSI